jgi:oligopeptidase B
VVLSSVDNQYATYALDLVGRRIYTYMLKSFTGEILKDTIENATGNSTWANDNQTIFYTRRKTLRSDKVLDIK